MEFYTDEEIGQIIKRHRMVKNLTQKELGELIGVQPPAVQKWECGKVTNIKRCVLQKLAIELSISPVTLIGIKIERDDNDESTQRIWRNHTSKR